MAFEFLHRHLPDGDDQPEIPRIPPVKEPDPDVPEFDKETDDVIVPLKNAALEDQPK